MKVDERRLLEKLIDRDNDIPISSWEIAQSIGMHYKRARYILRDKWTAKEWYEYGVSWRVGWLIDRKKTIEAYLG